MQTWMWAIAAVIVILPVVLMLAFNAGDTSDSRGRRSNRRWRVRKVRRQI